MKKNTEQRTAAVHQEKKNLERKWTSRPARKSETPAVTCRHQFEHLTLSLPAVVFSSLTCLPNNSFFLKLPQILLGSKKEKKKRNL